MMQKSDANGVVVRHEVLRMTSLQYHLLYLLKNDAKTILLSGIMTAASSLLITFFTSYLLNRLYNLQIAAVCSLLVVFAATIALCYFDDIKIKNIIIKFQIELLPQVWQHLLALPHRVISRYQSGDLAQRLYDYETALIQSAALSLQMILSFTSLLLVCLYLFYCSPVLTISIMLLTFIFHAGKLCLIKKNIIHISHGLMQKSQVTQFLQELFLQIDKIRSSQSESIVQNRWLQQYTAIKKTAEKSLRIEVITALIDISIPLLFALCVYGCLLVMPKQNSFMLLQFMLTFTQFSHFSDRFSRQLASYIMLLPNLSRLHTLMQEPVECYDDSIALTTPLRGDIEFRNIYIRHHDQSQYLLKDVCMTIPAGKFVALIGPSGAGKTSIFKLILGLMTPESGMILLDDLPLQRYNQQDLRQQIGAVLQASQLQPGTILSNLSAHQQLTHDEAWQLAELVGLDQDIKAMPMQMHTFISDHAGESLSGGQIQKILIARVLASKPRILLLDEATSALDNVSQQRIFQHLQSLNITRFVIAHRRSTIAEADYVYQISSDNQVSILCHT